MALWRSVGLILSLLLSSSVHATIVAYQYTGTITQVSGEFSGVEQGTAVSGIFSFDDGLVDLNLDLADNDLFTTTLNEALTPTWLATMTIDGYFSVAVNSRVAPSSGYALAFLGIMDLPSSDVWHFEIDNAGEFDGQGRGDNFVLSLFSSADAIALGGDNLTGNILDAINITDNLDLRLFTSATGLYDMGEKDNSGVFGSVGFDILSISRVSTVSEPRIAGLGAAGLLTLLVRRKRRKSAQTGT